MEYFCCGLHHSSYCPECLGKTCKERLIHSLDPQGGNEKKIAEIIRGEQPNEEVRNEMIG